MVQDRDMATRAYNLERFLARDATADGKFFAAVTTTRIYCVASCPARKPRPENVRFFLSAKGAERAGFRACKRCRPEAPRPLDPAIGSHADGELFEALSQFIKSAHIPETELPDVAGLARQLSVGKTRLNEVCRKFWHLAPRALLEELRFRRVDEHLARGATVIRAQRHGGFSSASSFQEFALRTTGMTPGQWAKSLHQDEWRLRLPEGIDIQAILDYHARDPESPSEKVCGRTLVKALSLPDHSAVLVMEAKAKTLNCSLKARGQLTMRDRRAARTSAFIMWGLDQETASFGRHARRMKGFTQLVLRRPGLRIPKTATPFESLIWAILGQQVNLTFAGQLRRHIHEVCGRPTVDGMKAPPTPADVAKLDVEDLLPHRFSRRKAEYLIDSSRAINDGRLTLERLPATGYPAMEQALIATRGIGRWTLAYVLLRGCGADDCLPVGDAGLRSAAKKFFDLPDRPDDETLERLMTPLQPFRSLGTYHLWASLGDDQ